MELAPLPVRPFDARVDPYNYDEAVLSKFRTPHSEYTWQNKLKDERYFKLVMHENASKGWNTDKMDGYFPQLDPPMKTEPTPSSFSPSNSVRIYNMEESQKENPNSPKETSSLFSSPPTTFQRSGQTSSFKGYNNIALQQHLHNQPMSLKRTADSEVDDLEEMAEGPSRKSARFSSEERFLRSESPTQNQVTNAHSSITHVSQSQNSEENDTPRITDREDVYFTVIDHPLKHQVKEFNILPAGILQLMNHYHSSPSDYIVVKLLCDPKMEKGEIFLTAVSTHYSQTSTGEISIPSLKVTQKMLPGRTKACSVNRYIRKSIFKIITQGFVFRLMYELVVGGKIVQSEVTDEFFIWSNVNQKGYPREERKYFIHERRASNKKKVKPKRRTPGRPRKKENDEIEFEDE